jgi:glutamate dehydrogenase (NAD(P)+)
MGVTVDDLETIYDGAGAKRLRSGLFAQVVDGDPAAYHFTGHGVIGAVAAIADRLPFSLRGASVAIEGFGQVGVGCARRAVREGAKVVAVTTISGGVYNPAGLDVATLLEMRREVGDECVVRYRGGTQIAKEDIYYLPVDILIPGARPDVIRADNVDRVQARAITSGGNLTVTDEAHEILFRRGTVCIPDFVSNAGAAIASWVDFLSGSPQQALRAIDNLISRIAREVMDESHSTDVNLHVVARRRVERRIIASRGLPRMTFDATREHIRALLGDFVA